MRKQSTTTVTSGSRFERKFGFCRALRVGDAVYVAGTAPIGEDGKTVEPGNAEAQARRCFEIIEGALAELGAEMNDVVRTRMFLTRIETDCDAVGGVHGEVFTAGKPVATMVGVAKLIDSDWLVEIEADAVV